MTGIGDSFVYSRYCIFSGIFSLLLVAGCANSNTPLVEDTTSLSLGDIVNRITCEAAEPIKAYLMEREPVPAERVNQTAIDKRRAELSKSRTDLEAANNKLQAELAPIEADLQPVSRQLDTSKNLPIRAVS